jgi:S1-C subfamily serine protease
MRSFLNALCFVVLSGVCGYAVQPAAADWNILAMNIQIDQTNFLVNDNCSGTLIDAANGYILTANHCIQAQYQVVEREKIDDKGVVTKEKVRVAKVGTVSQLVFKGANEVRRTTYVFKIKASDLNLDLALLEVQTKLPNHWQASLAGEAPVRGDTVYVVGNPMGVLYSSVTKGIVSSVERNYPMIGVTDQADNGLVQISSGVIGGNSGGAAYNDSGQLIGVPVRASQMNEILGLAVPLSDIKAFLKAQDLERLWASCGPAQ